MPLHLHVQQGLTSPEPYGHVVLAQRADQTRRVILGSDEPSGRQVIQLPRREASLEHLGLAWFPNDRQVLVQNLSVARTVVVYSWGCAPYLLGPTNSWACDCRVAVRMGVDSEYWAYVSPDLNDWTFEFEPARYIREHPEFNDPSLRDRVTPPSWVEVYRALSPFVSDEHRRSVAVFHQRQLLWPPTCLPDRAARYSQAEVARRFAQKDPANVSRDLGMAAEAIKSHYQGDRLGIMDFLARNKLITYASVRTMLRQWDEQSRALA